VAARRTTKTVAKTAAGKTGAGKTAAGKTGAGKTAAGKTGAGKTAAGKTAAGKTGTGKTAAGRSGRRLRSQGQATRAKLLEAGVVALADKGYAACRVDDVVRTAGVSHGTFYLYFANMQALFRALADQCAADTEALAESLGPVPSGDDGRDVLRVWLAGFLHLYRRYGVVIRAWSEGQVRDGRLARRGAAAFATMATTLGARMVERPGADTGQNGQDLRPAALVGMLERFAYAVTARDAGFEDEAVLDTLATIVHRGFFRRPGGDDR